MTSPVRALVLGDAVVVAVASLWALTIVGYYSEREPRIAVAALMLVAIALGALALMGSYHARLRRTRTDEAVRIVRAMAVLVGIVAVLALIQRLPVRAITAGSAVACSIAALLVWRAAFRAWMQVARRRGRFRERVVLVGTDDEAARVMALLRCHAELGLDVVGVVGDRNEAVARGMGAYWRGGLAQAELIVAELRPEVVVLAVCGLPSQVVQKLLRQLRRQPVEVQVATGVAGIDVRHLHTLPVAHEPLLVIDGVEQRRRVDAVKRLIDVVVSAGALLVLSPLLGLVALAVRMIDGGPVLFRQVRVGREGRGFQLLKFRTMVVDAEARVEALRAENERAGPLFKMTKDPRVTRLGGFLRESSLDELPQLLNVLKGDMSLVGPRPALPSEVANFDPGLRARHEVRPGITGLWQVEARDNPAFDAYRRLDLFYVENRSLRLDALVVLATVEHVFTRVIWAATKLVDRSARDQHTAPPPLLVRAEMHVNDDSLARAASD